MRRKRSKTENSELATISENDNATVDLTHAMDKATETVIADQTPSEQKKIRQRSYGDRPEHLWKPMKDFTENDHRDYHLYMAKKFGAETAEPAGEMLEPYKPEDFVLLAALGNKVVEKRFGKFWALDNDELIELCKALCPIFDKWLALPAWAVVFKPLAGVIGGYAMKRALLSQINGNGNESDYANRRDTRNRQDDFSENVSLGNAQSLVNLSVS